MKIFILTVGSRGDVQPYVALGKGLQQAGHEVTLCTSSSFAEFVEAHGVTYAYMNDEIIQLIDSDAAREAMENTDSVLAWIKTAVSLMKQVKPIQRKMLQEGWEAAQGAAQGADAIIYHPKTLGGAHIAEKLGIPGFLSVPAPLLTPTAAFPNAIFPEWPLGGGYNRFTYSLTNVMARGSYAGLVNEWRKETLGLPKQSQFHNEVVQTNGEPVLTMYSYSDHVVARPADWPETTVATGYWFLDQDEAWQPPEELVDFLEAGPPPVYVGFGSMSGRQPEKVAKVVIEALTQAGQRGLIATGWGGLQASDLPPTIYKIEAAPHDWLFPRVAAVVHHGGAGTTAAGLRAGKPTIICPFFGDQPFWGKWVHRLGVGPEPIPQKKLTAARLAAAIEAVMGDRAVQQKAAALGEKIRAEDGIGAAVKFIEAHVRQGESLKLSVV